MSTDGKGVVGSAYESAEQTDRSRSNLLAREQIGSPAWIYQKDTKNSE